MPSGRRSANECVVPCVELPDALRHDTRELASLGRNTARGGAHVLFCVADDFSAVFRPAPGWRKQRRGNGYAIIPIGRRR